MKKNLNFRFLGSECKLERVKDFCGAGFIFSEKNPVTRTLQVSAHFDFNTTMSFILHELFEIYMAVSGAGFKSSSGNNYSSFFMFDHAFYSNMIGEVHSAYEDIRSRIQ